MEDNDYLENMISEELDYLLNELIKFLNDCGIELTSKTFNSAIRKLQEVIAIRKEKSYIGLTLNDLGYVRKFNEIDTIIEKQNLPEDILRGYYKIENGKIVLDERMKEKLWR